MSDHQEPTINPDSFDWHPDYHGKTYDSVYRGLVDSIRRDQAAYQTALANAEKEEHGAFNTVRDLEKRWSAYDFAWFEQDAEQLASKILSFEQDRESRQEMIEWQDWKSGSAGASPQPQAPTRAPGEKVDWRENLSEEQRKKIASALSILVLLGLALVCVLLYFLVAR